MTLPAGSILYRVHGQRPANSFNPTAQPSVLDGGRFDSLDGSYSYLYTGYAPEGAMAETIARDLPVGGQARIVPRVRIKDRQLTQLRVERDLRLLVLHGAALTKVDAPLSLTKSEADCYLTTRAWAKFLLDCLPEIDGFRYRCRHDEDELAVVLFGGINGQAARADGAVTPHGDPIALDAEGEGMVQHLLAQHNATLAGPSLPLEPRVLLEGYTKRPRTKTRRPRP